VIVVDASALAKLILREEGWESVTKHLAAEESITVDHALKEVLNAVWKAARLRGLIDPGLAYEKHRALMLLVEKGVVHVEPEEAYLDDAFRIAMEAGLTVYDSLYLAQAGRRQAKLLTCDTRQAKAAEEQGIDVVLLA